jgi:homoserine dehydrogenase
MRTLNIALLGFGNVGRALAELLLRKQATLREDHGLNFRVVGIHTGRHGSAIEPRGIDLRTALDAVRFGTLEGLHEGKPVQDAEDFLSRVPAELVFETIPTNPQDGQPALGYIQRLLERGIHVTTANKGPVVFGHRQLTELGLAHGAGFFFESSVMDGAPIFSAAREGLPGADIQRIRGIFNSTTNYILTRMERDSISFDAAVKAAQKIGIAESDPTLDVDGWDASIKTAILANVLMGADLRPADVDREGIRGIGLDDLKAAAADGTRIKLMCEALRGEDGRVTAGVRPARIPLDDLFAGIGGTTSIIDLYTDVLPRLTIVENDPGPVTTAYGLLADMINLARGRHLTCEEAASAP